MRTPTELTERSRWRQASDVPRPASVSYVRYTSVLSHPESGSPLKSQNQIPMYSGAIFTRMPHARSRDPWLIGSKAISNGRRGQATHAWPVMRASPVIACARADSAQVGTWRDFGTLWHEPSRQDGQRQPHSSHRTGSPGVCAHRRLVRGDAVHLSRSSGGSTSAGTHYVSACGAACAALTRLTS